MTEERKKMSLARIQAEKRGGGLRCPKCWCPDLRKVWIRHTDPGMDRRKARCRNCGYEFLTYEHVGMFSPADEKRKEAQEAKKLHRCNELEALVAKPIDKPKKPAKVKRKTKGRARPR